MVDTAITGTVTFCTELTSSTVVLAQERVRDFVLAYFFCVTFATECSCSIG